MQLKRYIPELKKINCLYLKLQIKFKVNLRIIRQGSECKSCKCIIALENQFIVNSKANYSNKRYKNQIEEFYRKLLFQKRSIFRLILLR